jgi:hypothetical protein
MERESWLGAASVLFATALILGAGTDAAAQFGGGIGRVGGGGGVGGGGARPTGGSSMGYNRAGTASSGGFSYGDAPRSEPTVTVAPGAAAGAAPCNVNPVSVDKTLYYKCGATWSTPALTDTGISYEKVAPPPGH